LLANAMTIYNFNGMGYGFMGSLMSKATYLALSSINRPFVTPEHPSRDPVHGAAATAAVITAATCLYDSGLTQFTKYNKLDKLLKAQILKATHTMYFAHGDSGFLPSQPNNFWIISPPRTAGSHALTASKMRTA
jgi:hypothetical protein